MRDIRGDVMSVAAVIATVAAVSVALPFDALSFRPSRPRAAAGAFAAFVTLGAEDEAAAMKAAKSSWNAEAGGVRRLRAELFTGELPESVSEPALEIEDRFERSAPALVEHSLSPYQPSLAAPPPTAIPREKAEGKTVAAPTFQRGELLKID